MDVLLSRFSPLSTIYNVMLVPGCLLSVLFICLVLYQTPKYMIIYRYTMLNTSIWSFLIIVHLTLLFRPVTFLPLPICAVTGITKYMGWTVASVQLVVGLLLVANKALSLLLCTASNYLSLACPLYVRQMTFRKGVLSFVAIHLVVSLMMVGTAYVSYGGKHVLNQTEINHHIRLMYPRNADQILEITNNSPVIGLRTISLSSFATGLFLFLCCLTIFLSLVMMNLALSVIDRSFSSKGPSKYTHCRKRLKLMLMQRTLLPIFTYTLPITLAIAIAHFEVFCLTSWIQWLLLQSFVSPFICSTVTMVWLPSFRKSINKLAHFHYKEFLAGPSDDSDSRKLSRLFYLSPSLGRRLQITVLR